MKAIKKIIEVILAIVACISLVLMCAEMKDGSVNITWSIGWMAAFAVSAKILDRMGAFKDETL